MRFIYTARQKPSIPENARLWEAGAQFFERDGPRPFIWKIAHASHRRIAIVASAAQSNYPARWWKPLPDGRILANSPQAKGRVERRNGLLQDRLVKALRLRGISDLAGANQYLEQEFLRELNGQFTGGARQSGGRASPGAWESARGVELGGGAGGATGLDGGLGECLVLN